VSQAQFLADASQWVVQAAFWSAAGFILWYSFWAPWFKSPIGRAIIALDSAIALACLPTVLGLIFGASLVMNPAFSWLTVAAFACIPVITVYRAWVVARIQLRAVSGGQPRRTLLARIRARHRQPESGDDADGS
jgi:hypothetical protein